MLNKKIDINNVNTNPSVNKTYPIRVIHVDDIQNSISRFYEMYAHEPVIIKGAFNNNQFLQNFTPKQVEQLLHGQNVYSYDDIALTRVLMPASKVFDGIRRGATTIDITHPLDDTALADKVEIPPFLQFNWFADSSEFHSSPIKDIFYSPKGLFTPLHIDFYGVQSWMYVVYGKKVWECYPPKYLPILFDSLFNEFYNTRKNSPEQFPLANLAEKFVATIEAGDLIFVPAGWPHQVETLEETFTIKGVLINDYQIEDSIKTWLWSRALYEPGFNDLKQLILNLPPERMSGEEGYKRTQAALALCNKWEAHILRRWFIGDKPFISPKVSAQ